jgi:hypothetical protein
LPNLLPRTQNIARVESRERRVSVMGAKKAAAVKLAGMRISIIREVVRILFLQGCCVKQG